MLPAAVYRLGVNKICIHDLGGSATNVIHSTNPRHLIIRFELFGHTLTLCHLFYQQKGHIFRLPLDVLEERKIAIRLSKNLIAICLFL